MNTAANLFTLPVRKISSKTHFKKWLKAQPADRVVVRAEPNPMIVGQPCGCMLYEYLNDHLIEKSSRAKPLSVGSGWAIYVDRDLVLANDDKPSRKWMNRLTYVFDSQAREFNPVNVRVTIGDVRKAVLALACRPEIKYKPI